jgi:hypothetical protein
MWQKFGGRAERIVKVLTIPAARGAATDFRATDSRSMYNRRRQSSHRVDGNLSHQKTSRTGECAMARLDSGYLPRGNPCAQCGEPIAVPDWIEHGPGRTSYLWNCRACGYRFEAVAIYSEAGSEPAPLAA